MKQSDFQPFYLYLIAEKGLSANTAKAYLNDLRSYEKWMKCQVVDLDQEALEDFLAFLRKKGDAESSISRRVCSLKMYFIYLSIVGESKKEVFFESLKAVSLLPAVLTEKEVESLLKEEATGYFSIALELIYACGLRVSEVCALNIVDIGKDTLLVRGKGGKERVVPVASRTKERLDAYLNLEKREKEQMEPLFVNYKGQRMTRQEVWVEIKKAAKKAGIEKNVSPHTLRHSYATHMLERGADLRVIQELLGHSSITTTERYTHISKKKLQENFSKFHPLEDE
ncbi:tyrosine-type recombinase/integrase [bacterium]|nr:tyrosine-type recombinase/integrase [bacterium]